MKILLLEDDFLLAEIIEEHLQSRGDEVYLCSSSHEADNLLLKMRFDLLLLDVNVLGINGFELLETVRKEGFEGAAIFITALQDVKDLKRGFSSGADDYIRKPFDLDELDIRICNVLRLKKHGFSLNIDENISLDVESNTLHVDGVKYQLRNKECQVLAHLIRQRGKIVSQDELISSVWGYEEQPEDSTLRSYIKNLRKLIGSDSIKTFRNAGYRID